MRLALGLLLVVGAPRAQAASGAPFGIEVRDAATGRGVPMVELETVHGVVFVTDSAGWAAVREPGLMGREVYFSVRAHGYDYPADGFGNRGFRATLEPGGRKTIEVRRRNVAERLYRVTGEGIYRDSVLLGEPAPLRQPLLAGGVLGQDSVMNAVYRGRLLWFWGDTNRASYPLGNFHTSGAWSALPGGGGLDPERGVDLHYFTGDDGFARAMFPFDAPGVVWIDGLMTLGSGDAQQLLCHYARMKSLGERLEHGIGRWNDREQRFEKLAQLLDAIAEPRGRPLRVRDAGRDYYVFPWPYPDVRVPAEVAAVCDAERYQTFTCLAAGSRWSGPRRAKITRDARGQPRWGWRPGTAVVDEPRWQQLRDAGLVEGRHPFRVLTDVETGAAIHAHGGGVHFDAYRGRWIMIALQQHGGPSALGEVWYAEADDWLGPWVYARRIVSHDHYSFYNVALHPYFDRDGGRRIYFEGTYTATFSAARHRTPRYDYNQILYALDVDDPRLSLPAPVRRVEQNGDSHLRCDSNARGPGPVLFYAVPPGRAFEGAVPIRDGGEVAFLAAPPDRDAPPLVDLYAFRSSAGVTWAAADAPPPGPGWRRDEQPVARVWRVPR